LADHPAWSARLVIVLVLAGFPIALILAWAFALLDQSLQTPSGITLHQLRLDPLWDPLRPDPRFQQMLAKFGAQK